MIHLLAPLFRPLRYLDPNTGSLIIQLIAAALGGGLFFLIRAKWSDWFGKGKKSKKADGVEEEDEDTKSTSKAESKTVGRSKVVLKTTNPKVVEKETVKKSKRIK